MNARIWTAAAVLMLLAGLATVSAISGPGDMGLGRMMDEHHGDHGADHQYGVHGVDHQRGEHGAGHDRGEHGADHDA